MKQVVGLFGCIPLEIAAGIVISETTDFDEAQQAQIAAAFAKFDLDDSGCLDKHEIYDVLSFLGMPAAEEDIMEMLGAVDDGDSELNFAEFVVVMKKFAQRQYIQSGKSLSKFSYRAFALGQPASTNALVTR